MANTISEHSRLPAPSLVHPIVLSPFCANPFSLSATRRFRFCVPDEWYRRSKSRSVSSSSMEPSQNTIRRLAALQEEEDEEEEAEEEGTAKMSDGKTATPAHSPNSSADWRGTMSQNRLSSMFDGWLSSSGNRSSVVLSTEDKRKSVSEPRLVQQHTGGSIHHSESESDTGDESGLDEDFNRMLVSKIFSHVEE
jgi:diaphanous 1